MFDILHLISIPAVFVVGLCAGIYLTLPSTRRLVEHIRRDITAEIDQGRDKMREDLLEMLNELEAKIEEKL